MHRTLTAPDGRSATLRPATALDLGPVLTLLGDLQLPTAGVPEWWQHFAVAETGEGIVAVVGLELYGRSALLRSVAVHPSWRGAALGRALVGGAVETAADLQVCDLYLLTTTAEGYFARLGFKVVPRSSIPDQVLGSVEFRDACPASAIAMHRALLPSPMSD